MKDFEIKDFEKENELLQNYATLSRNENGELELLIPSKIELVQNFLEWTFSYKVNPTTSIEVTPMGLLVKLNGSDAMYSELLLRLNNNI